MSRNGQRRRRADMIAETTAKLVSAARRSFARHGYAAASMDELCAEAGLTRGALYHHFGGKEGLLQAVVHQMEAEIAGSLEDAFSATPEHAAAFRASCAAFLTVLLQPEVQQILLRDAPAVLGRRSQPMDARSPLAAMVASLDTLMAAGAVRRTDPEALARLLSGAMMDVAVWVAQGDEPSARLARARSALDAVLDGLGIPPPVPGAAQQPHHGAL